MRLGKLQKAIIKNIQERNGMIRSLDDIETTVGGTSIVSHRKGSVLSSSGYLDRHYFYKTLNSLVSKGIISINGYEWTIDDNFKI